MIESLGKLMPSVPASPPPAASKAGECKLCDSAAFISTQKLSNPASVSCNCKALDGYDLPESQSVFKVYEDEENPLDDWEFAGDEEKEDAEDVEASAETSRHLAGAITVPNLLQISLPLPAEVSPSIAGDSDHSNSSLEVRTEVDEHVDEELGQSSACDWLEPPLPCGAVAMQERHQIGGESIMLEAFQQFQQNPKIQEMVVALATDARVWRAVLANKKLQECRIGHAEGDVEVRITQDFNSAATQSKGGIKRRSGITQFIARAEGRVTRADKGSHGSSGQEAAGRDTAVDVGCDAESFYDDDHLHAHLDSFLVHPPSSSVIRRLTLMNKPNRLS